jgi:hypothetical protein
MGINSQILTQIHAMAENWPVGVGLEELVRAARRIYQIQKKRRFGNVFSVGDFIFFTLALLPDKISILKYLLFHGFQLA